MDLLPLTDQEKLLERWITAYGAQLRPKPAPGHYHGAAEWRRDADLKPLRVQWNGEAAAKLTGSLKLEIISAYLKKIELHEMLIVHNLRKDPNGDVEMLNPFWELDITDTLSERVHPILVYADLMAMGNQRNLEAAKKIYAHHIVQLIWKT